VCALGRPLFLLLTASILASKGEAQPAHELLERASYTEEARGDLHAAIDLYGKVAAARDADRPTVARALLRLGVCYLKLGRKDEAGAAFHRLKSSFPEQKAILGRIPEGVPRHGPPPLSKRKEKEALARDVHTFLSLALRHLPTVAGVTLDPGGWVSIDELLAGAARGGFAIEREELEEIVRTDKARTFRISPDGRRIRASGGHTVPVDLGLSPVTPPEALYHGLPESFMPRVLKEGLKHGPWQFVPLSIDIETAATVALPAGQRREVVLRVAAAQMHSEGFHFFLAENGVWLTADVPPRYISRVKP
jgi:putative RNA 2'-phosphotransferase